MSISKSLGSFYSTNFMTKKIPLQTKYKKRGTNQIIQNNVQSSNKINLDEALQQYKVDLKQKFENSYQAQLNNPQDNQFSRTQRFLSRTNFSHHNGENCFCKDCNCGRHHCKLNLIKPDFRKISTYRSNFKKNKSILTHRIIHKQDNHSLGKVQMNSTYTFSYKDKDRIKVQKHHPNDLLSFEGPLADLTSYKTHFPGNKGNNPYVKPKQLFVGGNFPLKNQRTAYNRFFNRPTNFERTQTQKIKDQLKIGKMNFFNESFYNEKFKSPNKEDYALKYKSQNKISNNPNYSHQFGSTYLQDFVPIKTTVCSAKIKIQKKSNNLCNLAKINFKENSDFKAMSSNYKALSLAPLGQY